MTHKPGRGKSAPKAGGQALGFLNKETPSKYSENIEGEVFSPSHAIELQQSLPPSIIQPLPSRNPPRPAVIIQKQTYLNHTAAFITSKATKSYEKSPKRNKMNAILQLSSSTKIGGSVNKTFYKTNSVLGSSSTQMTKRKHQTLNQTTQ